jgi:hypothetical protein
MLHNYLTIAWRNLTRHKAFSGINLAGLSVGMTVSMLIGLWMWDELTHDQYHENYDRIARVMQHQALNGEVLTGQAIPFPLGNELRRTYGGYFKSVVMSSWTGSHMLAYGGKTILQWGNYMEADAPEMLTLKMLKGSRSGLQDPASVLLSASVAQALFGNADPMDKINRLDNNADVKVTGVYEDLPHNSSFSELGFVAPWSLYVATTGWIKESQDRWDNNSFQLFVQLAPNAEMEVVSARIRNAKRNRVDKEDLPLNAQVFLHPMRKWHLYSEFENGVNAGGRIEYVRLFGIIGAFVLLLACINFMNLSTARSEKRAREVGIRKAIGSGRPQLIGQFLSESLLIVGIALGLALLLVVQVLPFFNQVADKRMTVPWTIPGFWLLTAGFSLFTGLLAGSYPALYLSSFQPVRVLKGTFRVGRLAAVPRKALVVLQFTVSVTLIIGTIVVFRQIQHAKNRPVGYSREGLLVMRAVTPDLHTHYDALRNDLLATGAVTEMAESCSPPTEIWSNNGGFNWRGKDPDLKDNFGSIHVSPEYGRTVGWQFREGRDFSREFASDSAGLVLNEAAVKFMGLEHPVGEMVKWGGKDYRVLGVIKDMVMESPYEPTRQTVFYIAPFSGSFFNVRVNPRMGMPEALRKIEPVFRKYSPAAPFDYKFADQEYAAKFGAEERIGKLASCFAALAIFISCLGLYGLASFMAEQRIKEIGIRKVLGASVFTLWRLLSKDFLSLVLLSLLVAGPVAYGLLHAWLLKYEYRTGLSAWIFAATAGGALGITLLTVSHQAIKAALTNPVKSLRSE